MPDLVLKVEGQRLTGWTALELTRSLEAVAGSFSLEVSDRDGFPVPEGAALELFLEGQALVTGFADVVRPRFDPRSRSVTVQGRDKTADLVDCVPVDAEAEFSDLTLDGLAHELARPFGIEVVVAGDPGAPFPRFALQPGETAFEALERAGRLRGVLLTTDGLGRLVLENPGIARAEVALVEGTKSSPGNVIAGTGGFNRSERFRRYVVKGSRPGSDLIFGDELQSEAEAFDDAVRKSRSTLILAEASIDQETAQRRAEWEATVRRARGSALQLVVQGWRQKPGGALWRPNTIARVVSPTLRVDRELLISATRFRLDARTGTTCELELMPSDAFQPKPVLDVASDLADDLADPEDG